MNNILGRVVDFALHLHSLFLLMAHFDTEDSEVAASQIECNEVSFLCCDGKSWNTGRKGKKEERERAKKTSVQFKFIYRTPIHNNSLWGKEPAVL